MCRHEEEFIAEEPKTDLNWIQCVIAGQLWYCDYQCVRWTDGTNFSEAGSIDIESLVHQVSSLRDLLMRRR